MMNRMMLRRAGGVPVVNPFADALVAYSLRNLGLGVTNVVRVRRDSDNTEQDFTATQITDGTLTSFCGAGNGFVSVWYDQKGVYNAIQATSIKQPKIVNLGNLFLENGKPIINCSPTDSNKKGFVINTINPISRPNSLFICGQFSPNSEIIDTNFENRFLLDFNSIFLRVLNPNNVTSNIGINEFSNGILSTININNVTELKYNQQSQTLNTGSGSIGSTIKINDSTFNVDLKLFEITLFDSDKTNQLSDIETNINNYYNIY